MHPIALEKTNSSRTACLRPDAQFDLPQTVEELEVSDGRGTGRGMRYSSGTVPGRKCPQAPEHGWEVLLQPQRSGASSDRVPITFHRITKLDGWQEVVSRGERK